MFNLNQLPKIMHSNFNYIVLKRIRQKNEQKTAVSHENRTETSRLLGGTRLGQYLTSV